MQWQYFLIPISPISEAALLLRRFPDFPRISWYEQHAGADEYMALVE
jgi:hypothetical protein